MASRDPCYENHYFCKLSMPWMSWTTSNLDKCPIKYEFSQRLRSNIKINSLGNSWQTTLDWLCISAGFRHWICLAHAELLVAVLRVVMTNLQHTWAPSPRFTITIKTWPGITNCIFIICTTLLNSTGVTKEAGYCQSLYSIFLDLCLDKEAGQSIYSIFLDQCLEERID